jgi:ABC-2 type transport system ATP-binding protein
VPAPHHSKGKPSPSRQPIIKCENISVSYGNKVALDSVSFDIYDGEVFGLLGSNGAGKSTLLSCLARLNRGYKGSLTVLGHEIKKHRETTVSQIALVPQEFSFFSSFTVYENLRFACSCFNIKGKEMQERINSLMADYQLEGLAKMRASSLSGGYKRLLNIAISVVKKPKIILLDEPTAGLDVEMRQEINGAIKRFRAQGATVILTTHYLEDVEDVCDRVALLSLGKVVAYGTIDELVAKHGGPYNIILSDISAGMDRLIRSIEKSKLFVKAIPGENKLHLVCPQESIVEALSEISAITSSNRVRIGKIDVREPSLNKVFLGTVGLK